MLEYYNPGELDLIEQTVIAACVYLPAALMLLKKQSIEPEQFIQRIQKRLEK